MAAHRYWRILIHATDQLLATAVGELELRATPGGANQTGSGTALANGHYISGVDGPHLPDYAFNNQNQADAPYWWQYNTSQGAFPHWLGYDFGAGGEVEVEEVVIHARLRDTAHAPITFDLQHSDDGSAWTTEWSVWDEPVWANGEVRAFTEPAPTITTYDLVYAERSGRTGLYYRNTADLATEKVLHPDIPAFTHDWSEAVIDWSVGAIFVSWYPSYVYRYPLGSGSYVWRYSQSYPTGIAVDTTRQVLLVAEASGDYVVKRDYSYAFWASGPKDAAGGGGPILPECDPAADLMFWGNGPNKTLKKAPITATTPLTTLKSSGVEGPLALDIPNQRIFYRPTDLTVINVIGYDGAGDTVFWEVPDDQNIRRFIISDDHAMLFVLTYTGVTGEHNMWQVEVATGESTLIMEGVPTWLPQVARAVQVAAPVVPDTPVLTVESIGPTSVDLSSSAYGVPE